MSCLMFDDEAVAGLMPDVIATVSGNIGASTNTWYFFPYPTGFNGTNCVVGGYSAETNDGHVWYSNQSEVTVLADGTNGVRIKTSSQYFTNSPFKIVLLKCV